MAAITFAAVSGGCLVAIARLRHSR
jgi:hypothetical protein